VLFLQAREGEAVKGVISRVNFPVVDFGSKAVDWHFLVVVVLEEDAADLPQGHFVEAGAGPVDVVERIRLFEGLVAMGEVDAHHQRHLHSLIQELRKLVLQLVLLVGDMHSPPIGLPVLNWKEADPLEESQGAAGSSDEYVVAGVEEVEGEVLVGEVVAEPARGDLDGVEGIGGRLGVRGAAVDLVVAV
jgi:hypothetical protein